MERALLFEWRYCLNGEGNGVTSALLTYCLNGDKVESNAYSVMNITSD